MKKFLVDSLTSARSLGLATNDDILEFAPPDTLAQHLPRPLWAQLLASSLASPKLDATVVIDTIGIAQLCEHLPQQLTFGCVTAIAKRSLGKPMTASSSVVAQRSTKSTMPPPSAPANSKTEPVPLIPSDDEISNLAASLSDAIDDALLPTEEPRATARPPTAPVRSGMSTRPGASSRKPPAPATISVPSPTQTNGSAPLAGRVPAPLPPPVRRGMTELETFDADFSSQVHTKVADSDGNIASDESSSEEQLVEWQPRS